MEKHLYQNSEVIYCAQSLDHCWELFEQDLGEDGKRETEESHDPFEQIPDDRMQELGSDDSNGAPGEYTKDHLPGWWFERKTAGAWAAECNLGHVSGGDY